MINKLTSNKYVGLSLLIILFALSYKIFPAWIAVFRKEWLLFILAAIIIISNSPKKLFGTNLFMVWCIYSLCAIFKGYTHAFLFPSVQFAVCDIFMLFVAAFLPLYVISQNDQRFIKTIVYGTFIMLVVECVSSFFVTQTIPGAIRNMHTMLQEEGATEVYRLYRMGVADYGLCHAVPCLIPPLFYLLRTNSSKKLRTICIVTIAECVLLTWLSEATTALLLAILMLVLAFLTSKGRNESSVIISMIFIPFLISDTLQLLLLDGLDSILGNDTIFSVKTAEMRHSIMHGENMGDLAGRMDRYGHSFNMFFSSPLWGSNGEVGRHSALLDRLATFGLLGFIPLIMFFTTYFKRINHLIPRQARIFFTESILAGTATLIAKGMWLWPIFFCVCVVTPFMLIVNINKQDKNAKTHIQKV